MSYSGVKLFPEKVHELFRGLFQKRKSSRIKTVIPKEAKEIFIYCKRRVSLAKKMALLYAYDLFTIFKYLKIDDLNICCTQH